MAFKMVEKYRKYICLSGDTKITSNIEEGSELKETDTGLEYVFNGVNWVYSPNSVQISDGTNNVEIIQKG